LGDLIDSSLSTVSRWEIGERTPGGEDLTELAKALGTTSAYLMGETDDPRAPLAAAVKINPRTEVKEIFNERARHDIENPSPVVKVANRGDFEELNHLIMAVEVKDPDAAILLRRNLEDLQAGGKGNIATLKKLILYALEMKTREEVGFRTESRGGPI
jgi:transcriptional regulator with XRE-family HTH domain